MMRFMKIIIFAFLSVLILPAVHAASVYKWVDEDGQVHYGSRPASKDAKEVEIKDRYIDSGKQTAPLSAEERVKNQKRFLNALEAEQNSIKNEKKKKQKEEEEKLRRCNAARDQLRRYESSSALYDLDEKGDRILLNKEQYQKAMSQARARVKRWCE